MKINDLATNIEILDIIHDIGLDADGRFTLTITGCTHVSMLETLWPDFLAQREISATVFREEWPDINGWRWEWGTGVQITGYLKNLHLVQSSNREDYIKLEFIALQPPVFTSVGEVTRIHGPSMDFPPLL
jgi:hypothetical protein